MLHREPSAEIYLVQRRDDDTWWALKVLTDTNPRHLDRLEREVLVRDGLRHPHIVPAYEVLSIAGHAALVMDFVEGPSLRAWLRTERPTISQALQLFAGIVQAVSHAHDHGAVHRDIRPGNVLLAPAGTDRFTPRVADWGLAKVRADAVGPLGGLTTVQRSLGTAGYAAPEQVRDASSAGPPADVFSLGCLLYELLTGQGPFHGRSEMDAAMAAKNEEYTPIDRVLPTLHPMLARLVHDMLAGEPDRRPHDARAVWERLMELPPELSAEEPPVSPWAQGALLAAPLLVALVVGALVVAAF